MLALVSALAMLPALAAGQDLGMGALAAGMATQVASVVVDKVTDKVQKKMADGGSSMPCVGPHCCQHSTCMNLPGLRCSLDRGPTKCVGASTFPPKKGMCGCLVGACSAEGKCSSQGLPDSFEPQPGQAAQAPQQPAAQQPVPAQQQPQAAAAPAAPAAAAQPPASGEDGKFSQWHGQGAAPSGADQFSKWHTSSRLYSDEKVIVGRVPPEDFSLALMAYGGAFLSFFLASAFVCARAGRGGLHLGLREHRSVPEEEGLVDSEEDSLDAQEA